MSKFLYINGDSWVGELVSTHTNFESENFKDIFVINRGCGGASNIEIISRTKQDLEFLAKSGITPMVCVAFSEVGRGINKEFAIGATPDSNLTILLKNILIKEYEMLQQVLVGYNSFITTSWTTNPFNTNKRLLDFIDFDDQEFEVYTVGNGIYKWLSDHQHILKFNKDSFINAVNEKEKYSQALLNNSWIDDTMHIKRERSSKPYNDFFSYVLEQLKINDN